MTTIRVGGVPEHFNLPWHQCLESGRFAEAGVEVVYRDYPGGTGAMNEALATGEIDVAVLLTQGATASILSGNEARIVKTYVESPLLWGIHVAADSDLQTVDAIRGKRYAISRRGSGSHLMSIVDAAERGWPYQNLDFIEVGNIDGAEAALTQSQADTFFWEQFTTQPYVDRNLFRRIGVRETLWPAFVISVNQKFLDGNTEAVRQMLDVINVACETLMNDPEAVPLIAQRYELPVDGVAEWFSLTRWSTDYQRPTEAIAKVIEYLNRLHIVDAPAATIDDVWHDLT